MSRIGEIRKKILGYVEKQKCSQPLEFYSRQAKIIPLFGTLDNLQELIIEVLNNSNLYSSRNVSTLSIETNSGKYRSSFDICRHIKSKYPDIDIFIVMETIYKLRYKIQGHYCTTVHRTVFKSRHYKWEITGCEYIGLCYEYKTSFNSWRNLHE